MFCWKSNVCPNPTSLRIAHAVGRVLCTLTFIFFYSKTQTLVFCSGSSCTQVCGYNDNSCFSYVAWRCFFCWGISSMNSALFVCWLYVQNILDYFHFSYVYSDRPIWTPELSRLLRFSDPWLLSLLSVCKSLPDCMNLLFLDCSMPLLAVQPPQPLLHLSCGEMCLQRQIHTLMCCKVLGAQSCAAISRLLKLNSLCFHTSCLVCILGCGKHSLFACQTQLFCTWKSPFVTSVLTAGLRVAVGTAQTHQQGLYTDFILMGSAVHWGTPWCSPVLFICVVENDS